MTSYIKTDINKKPPDQRRLFFLGSSLKDFEDLPKDVKEDFLTGLTVARIGGTPPNMKPWKGLGWGVYELLEDHRGDTTGCLYGTFRGSNVRAPCIQEERNQDSPAGYPKSRLQNERSRESL